MKTVIGNPDTFKVLVRSSDAKEGWHKTTRAMEIPNIGCIVQVTTQRGNDISESLATVLDVVIIEDINNGSRLSKNIDTLLSTFEFTAATDIALSTPTESDSVLYAWYRGINEISISVGAEYSINGGDYTSDPGTITYGDSVTVRIESSGSNSTQVTATLTIGSDTAGFDVTTVAV